jgi:hypothetical protein
MKKFACLLLLSPLVAIAGCAAEKSENPLSPTVAGPIPGVEISAPRPLEPGAGQLIAIDRQPVTLLLENASSNGPRPLYYSFEVATDAGFANKVFARDGVSPGDGGRTALQLADRLGSRSYYWRAKAEDGANTGPYSAAASFNIYTPVVIDIPSLLSPVGNAIVSDLHPEFTIRNAPRSGPAGAIFYTMEVAENDAFANKFAVWQFPERSGETKFTAPADLLPGRQYFWRARASEASALGGWSATHAFRTPVPVVVLPTPLPVPGGSCSSSTTPLNILQCRRSRYPTPMSGAQIIDFLRASAHDLNAARVADGPFGVLRKDDGACFTHPSSRYSCDIICSGNGSSQKQWDVLMAGDPNQGIAEPTWNRLGAIVVRPCEIVP